MRGRAKHVLEADRRSRNGCVQLRTSRIRCVEVGIYRSQEAGMECDPTLPWSVVCEQHGTLVSTETLELARAVAPDPLNWCDECRENARRSGLEQTHYRKPKGEQQP